jgi:NADH:ubiquinone oxidoreductase subunit C
VYINQIWFYGLNIFLKNEVFFCNSSLLENSAVDNKNNFDFLKKNQSFFKNKILLFYVYYFFTLKSKLVLLLPFNSKVKKMVSVDKLFKSSSWLERETGEMFNVSYISKIDTRRLLLDYSKQENPLLKDYPCEGFNDVFYSFFDDQVVCNNSTTVEL